MCILLTYQVACVHRKTVRLGSPNFSSCYAVERWFAQRSNVAILQEIAKESLFGSTAPEVSDVKLKVIASFESDIVDVSVFYTIPRSIVHLDRGNEAIEAITSALCEQFPVLTIKSIDSLSSAGTNIPVGVEVMLPMSVFLRFGVTYDQFSFFHNLERSQVSPSVVENEVLICLSTICTSLGIDSSILFSADTLQSFVVQIVEGSTEGVRVAAVLKFDERILHLDADLSAGNQTCRRLLGLKYDPWTLKYKENGFNDGTGASLTITEALAGAALTVYVGALLNLTQSKKLPGITKT